MENRRSLALPTYLVAFALTCIPLFDVAMRVLPMRFTSVRWRFGAFGLASNALMLVAAGLLLATLAAFWFEHRGMQRVMATITSVLAVLMTGGLIFFVLDVLQVRREVAPAAALAFKVASVTGAMKAILGIVSLASLGIGSFRATTAAERQMKRPVSENLLVSRPAIAATVGK